MGRKRLTAKERKIIYNKCDGHCAYCGVDLPEKGWHVDHVNCIRNYGYDDGVEALENMLPACASCNIYKRTMDIEMFRVQLGKIPGRLSRDTSTYDIAMRFGLIAEIPEPIIFYYETMQKVKI